MKRTLYFGHPARLSLRNAQLLLRLPQVEDNDTLTAKFKQECERTFPIEDLGLVVLDDPRITVTHALLQALMAANCAVLTCAGNHMPEGLMLPMQGNTVHQERFAHQLECSKPLRKQLWQQTVQAKIRNQCRVLQRVEGVETGNMAAWSKAVRSGDAENLEARAAVYYWSHVFPEYPGFVRGRELLPPNNLLNYGYAILRAVVARSLVAAGLLPVLGIHHHNRYNAYCLADDVMEPYRPYVDWRVKEIIAVNENVELLTTPVKQALLSIPTIDVAIDRHQSTLMAAVDATCISLCKCFAGEKRMISYPEM